MNNHPISNNFSFKELIYSLNLLQIIILFIFIFTLFSFVFFGIYKSLLSTNISNLTIFKYAIYQSYGFDISGLKTEDKLFEFFNFFQLFLSLVLNLIFATSIILKYFTKPNFFYFKSKVNIFDDSLVISLYNKTNFQITNCHFDVYARLPYKDENGFNSLNNIKLTLNRDIFPFMDKHLVTRLKINLDNFENRTDFSKDGMNESLLSLVNKKREFKDKDIQYLNISVLLNGISDKLDNSIYEIHTYKIDVNSLDSITKYITFNPPQSIDIDMVDFSKSKGWETFDD